MMQIPLQGFLILRLDAVPDYRGVDRDPFEPEIISEEIDRTTHERESDLIWALYPPGWRQDAYRLFEENMICGQYPLNDLELVVSYEVATEIVSIIEPYLGPHEIMECRVWELGKHPVGDSGIEPPTIGYDVAYPGGYCFSAIRDGLSNYPTLHDRPSNDLVAKYGSLLNEHGLFSSTESILDYMKDYWAVTPYEATADYAVYWLSLR